MQRVSDNWAFPVKFIPDQIALEEFHFGCEFADSADKSMCEEGKESERVKLTPIYYVVSRYGRAKR